MSFIFLRKKGRCRVIGIIPDQIVTKHKILVPKLNGREVVSDVKRDILKIFVLERHTASGQDWQGIGTGVRNQERCGGDIDSARLA